MLRLFLNSIFGLLFILPSHTLGEGNSVMERFHMKRGCAYTNEMGEYLYKCIKANEGFNAHYCHNETVALFCPVNEEVKTEAAD